MARFRLRLGVSNVEELLGTHPIRSPGESFTGSCSRASSTSPIRSSRERRAAGVDGKVLACGKVGAFLSDTSCDGFGPVAWEPPSAICDEFFDWIAGSIPLPPASAFSLSAFGSPGANWKAFSLDLDWEVAGIGGFGGTTFRSASAKGALPFPPLCH